jgi:hypothetical protein
MADDDFISVVSELSDLVGITGVIAAKRKFCLSRTDNRRFELKNNFYKNEILLKIKIYIEVLEFRMTFFKLLIITSNSCIVPIFLLSGTSSSSVDQVIDSVL